MSISRPMSDPAVYGQGWHRAFKKDKLTLGIGYPIESYAGPVPQMRDQVVLGQKAEAGGFAALWCRDVPLLDPTFGDAGQLHDPWVWLGYILAHTTLIALGTGSIILPLRQPVDLAKAAASVDQLSQGRLILGVASGDRPVEYSVYKKPFDAREQTFRETFEFIRSATYRPAGWNNLHAVQSGQVELLPKAHTGSLPLLVTGNSRQSLDWIAQHADGWLMYPRPLSQQQQVLAQWHAAVNSQGSEWKPFAQSLYIDLTDDPDAPAQPIHLGYRLGRNSLIAHLSALQDAGVNHVTFNVKFSTRPVDEVLSELCAHVVPVFPAHQEPGDARL